MKKAFAVAACVALSFAAAIAVAQAGAARPAHQMVHAQNLKWGPMPLPGAQMAVVSGDPAKPGPFVIRIKVADKVQIPPHWHPADEPVTVLSGTLGVGMGDKFDAKKLEDMKPGDYILIPREMRHFALAKGETVMQVHGMGPFTINWVNPADVPAAPRK